MSVRFKESTQWYKIFYVATAIATAVYSKDMTKNTDYFKHLLTILCNKSVKRCPTLFVQLLGKDCRFTIIGSFCSLLKRNISYNCRNVLQNRTTIASPAWRSNLHPLLQCLACQMLNPSLIHHDFISGSLDFTQHLASGELVLIHSADACILV